MNYIRGNDYIVWFVMSLFVFFQFHELGGVYKDTKQFLDHVTFAEYMYFNNLSITCFILARKVMPYFWMRGVFFILYDQTLSLAIYFVKYSFKFTFHL